MPSSIESPEVRAVLASRPSRLTASPADWRDVLVYFLMVDRFNNPHAPPQHMPFDAPFGGFQGGTIAGMKAKLAYLKKLGVGAIWFTPVLLNGQLLDGVANEGTYHGYGIQDFLSIDPRFASNPAAAEEELAAFVDAAHAHGIYVIFDIVLNHTGDVFQYPEFGGYAQFDFGSRAPFSTADRPVLWRDANGNPTTLMEAA